jgi:hypothetical protein
MRTSSAITASASGTAAATTSSGAEAAAANPAYRVLKHLDYSGPGKASLRVGYYNRAEDKGFGWNKVKKKHNITKYSAIEYIAKSPFRNRLGNSATYHMTGYAGKYRCRNGVCTLVKLTPSTLTAKLTAPSSEKLSAAYTPLAWAIPEATTEDRYRYMGSYTKLR